jgi:hypothetical protein
MNEEIKSIQKIEVENFKVGVDNVIFSVDSQNNRLLVLLLKRKEEPFREKRNFKTSCLSNFGRKNSR